MPNLRKGKDNLRVARLGVVDLFSKIVFGSTGAVVSQTPVGQSGFVVTRAGTGRYTLTFDEAWNDLLCVDATVDSQGTVVDTSIQIFTGYVASTKNVSISHVVAGAEADPVSGNEMLLRVTMKSSDVG